MKITLHNTKLAVISLNLISAQYLFAGTIIDMDGQTYSTFDPGNYVSPNLENAILENSVLVGINLSNSNITNANLENAVFTNSNFSNTNLTGSDADNVSFNMANLINVNMGSASLNSAQFNGANLQGSNFDSAILEFSNFTDANISSANLINVDLSEVTFSNTLYDSNTVFDAGFDPTSDSGLILVPEPSSSLLIGLASIFLFARRKRTQ